MIDVAFFCLALNVYFEARSEPFNGQVAVAEVTIRRAWQSGDPWCVEVFREHQFTWTDNHYAYVTEDRAWETAKDAAAVAITENTDYSKGATHFHADYVRPKWARSLCETVRIGRHIFYKECQ